MSERKFALIENNTVVNILVGVDEAEIQANPEKYIEYTDNNWDFTNGIDGGIFFIEPKTPLEETDEPTDQEA